MSRAAPRVAFTLLLLVAVSWLPDVARAADEWALRPFEPPDGSAFEDVRDILVAENGAIWFVSWGQGVGRLEGSEWRVFQDHDGLPSNFCLSISEGPDGALWVGTQRGLAAIEDDGIRSVEISRLSPLMPPGITLVRRRRGGGMWVGTENGTLLSCVAVAKHDSAGRAAMEWNTELHPPAGIMEPVRDLLEIEIDGRHEIWVAAESSGVYRRVDGVWTRFTEEETGCGRVKRVVGTSDGNLWIAGTSVPRFLDRQENAWRPFDKVLSATHMTLAPDSRLVASGVNGLFEIQGGRAREIPFSRETGRPLIRVMRFASARSGWIGTKEGILQLVPVRWRPKTIEPIEATRGHAFHASPDRPPVAIDVKSRLVILDKKTDSWREVLRIPGEPGVHQVLVPSAGSVYWARRGDALHRIDVDAARIVETVSVPEAARGENEIGVACRADGTVLIYGAFGVHSRDADGWTRFSVGTWMPGGVWSIEAREDGSVLAAMTGAVELWKDGKVILRRPGERRLMPEGPKYCFAAFDRTGAIWTGTRGFGAVVFESEHGRRQHTPRNGLQSGRIVCFLEADDGSIWLGAEHLGVSSLKDGRWINYSHADGLPNDGIVSLGEYPAGTYWAAFDNYQIFRYRLDREAPSTVIHAGSSEVAAGTSAIFSFGGYDAWNETPDDELAFSCRLRRRGDFAAEWSPYRRETSWVSGDLEPGDYVFEVRAEDRDRNTDPVPATFPVTVVPSYWRGATFLLIFLFASLSGALGILWLARRRETAALQAEEQAMHEEMRALDPGPASERGADATNRVRQLESLARLADGIAHDFNNLLTGVITNISIAKSSKKLDRELLANLADAERASWRARDLAHQLLTYSRGGAPIVHSHFIESVIEESAAFVLKGSSVRLEIDVLDEPMQIESTPEELSLIVQSLALNAREAMPEGGTLAVAIENVTLGADGDERLASLDGRDVVRIEVRDDGAGIPPKTLPRVFEPRFSTKDGAEGLGLSSVRALVTSRAGVVTVDSEPGKGAVVRLYLPAADSNEDGRPAPCAARTVLVMDDDEFVRDAISRMLRADGFETLAARDGESALRVYESAVASGKRIDLAILDLTIRGGLNGPETMNRLRELDPSIKGVLTSGYSGQRVRDMLRGSGFSAILRKPFERRALRRAIREAMVESSAVESSAVESSARDGEGQSPNRVQE